MFLFSTLSQVAVLGFWAGLDFNWQWKFWSGFEILIAGEFLEFFLAFMDEVESKVGVSKQGSKWKN